MSKPIPIKWPELMEQFEERVAIKVHHGNITEAEAVLQSKLLLIQHVDLAIGVVLRDRELRRRLI